VGVRLAIRVCPRRGECRHSVVVPSSLRTLRRRVFVSWRCCRATGCVCWFLRKIFGVFLWLGRSACAWVSGFADVLGTGVATFVGRDRGAGRFATGASGRNGSGVVVNGFLVGVADGRIRVLIDGSRRATRTFTGPTRSGVACACVVLFVLVGYGLQLSIGHHVTV
jgi:hypothetical protein